MQGSNIIDGTVRILTRMRASDERGGRLAAHQLAPPASRLIPAWNFPILLLQGRDDPFQPFEFYEMALEHVPTAALHFMDCGHYYHLELPDQTEAVIRDFLHKPLS